MTGDMPKLRFRSVTLVCAWLGVLWGASGRVDDSRPGGCAEGGCIISGGIYTAVLAFPIVTVFVATTLVIAARTNRGTSQRADRVHRWGAFGAMAGATLILLASWFLPYWPSS